MKIIRDQSGIAMVTALLLTLVSLSIIAAVLYMLNQQTKLSAAQKTYSTAREAAYGDMTIITKEVIPKLFTGYSSSKLKTQYALIKPDFNTSDACLKMKLHNPSSQWSTVCPSDSAPLDPKILPDMVISLKGAPTNFRIYNKIVDTQDGNTDQSSIDYLLAAAGVTGAPSSAVSSPHVPYMYTIEVQAEREINPKEKANLSVLYAY